MSTGTMTKPEDVTHVDNGIKLVEHVIAELGISASGFDAEKIGRELLDHGFDIEVRRSEAEQREILRKHEEECKRAEEEYRTRFEEVAARCKRVLEIVPDLTSLTVGNFSLVVKGGKFVDGRDLEIPF